MLKLVNISGMSRQRYNENAGRAVDALCDCSRGVATRENDTVRLAFKSRSQISNTGNYSPTYLIKASARVREGDSQVIFVRKFLTQSLLILYTREFARSSGCAL